jgi:hypothetical protein
MNIRRVHLDVDWAVSGPGIRAVAQAIDAVSGVDAANITITEIDLETIGTDVAVEGPDVDLDALVKAIEDAGAVVHSIDRIAFGERIVEHAERAR